METDRSSEPATPEEATLLLATIGSLDAVETERIGAIITMHD